MRRFYLFYSGDELVHQLGGQLENREISPNAADQLTPESILCKIPWRHHVAIMSSCSTAKEAKFYIQQTIENNWSRNILQIQLDSNLIERQGKAQNNFNFTLPKPLSDLAFETLKESYKFDFLTLETNVQESI